MGGMHTAGDLVLRMQLAKGMKIDEAKKYVADKLGITVEELCDPIVMSEIREELGLGLQLPKSKDAIAMEAKINIAKVLGIKINSVEVFKSRANL